MIDYRKVELEYLSDYGDDDRMLAIKEAIRDLPQGQKTLFFNYCDIGTYAGVARFLKCSPTTVRKSIMKTRRHIWERLKDS